MKIDLDLNDIFDEEGDVEDSIKERIIQSITSRIYAKIDRDVSSRVDEILRKGIKEKLDYNLSVLIPDLMDYEFQQVNRYGDKVGEPTTVKDQILKALQSELTFTNARYESDNNAVTKCLHRIIEEQMKGFKVQFDKEVNAMFVKEAMDYATQQVKKKLGIQ